MSPSYEYLWNVSAWTSASDEKDSWGTWDGCAPIAGSMIMAYHEGVGSSKKEESIDSSENVRWSDTILRKISRSTSSTRENTSNLVEREQTAFHDRRSRSHCATSCWNRLNQRRSSCNT